MSKHFLIIVVICLAVGICLGYALSIGISKHKEGQWIKTAQELVDAHPKDSVKWVFLGNAKNFAGDSTGALVAYRKAFELDATSVEALQGIGTHYLIQQDWATAEEWFRKSLLVAEKFRPDAVYHTRGILDFIASMKNSE